MIFRSRIILSEITNMILIDYNFNGSDWGVLGALAVFVLLGLLFGASKTGAKIVLYVVSGFAGIFIANIVLAYIQPMDWYVKVVDFFKGNSTAVNWIATIVLTGIASTLLLLILTLISNLFIDSLNKGKVLTRIVGMVIGVLDWAVLLVVASFIFAALPRWLGASTPSWITQANDYLANSSILGRLITLYDTILTSLGLAK